MRLAGAMMMRAFPVAVAIAVVQGEIVSIEKRSHNLASLTGVASVYKDDKQIARVRYSLTVMLEVIVSKSFSNPKSF